MVPVLGSGSGSRGYSAPSTARSIGLLGQHPGTAGAALLALVAAGSATIDGGSVNAAVAPPSDALLRAVHEDVGRGRRPPRVGRWIDRFARRGAPVVRDHALAELAIAGVLRQRSGRRRSTEHPEVDPGPRQRLETRIRSVLAGADDPWAATLHQLLVAASGPAYLGGDGPSRREVLQRTRAWRRDRYPDDAVRTVVDCVARAASAPAAGA